MSPRALLTAVWAAGALAACALGRKEAGFALRLDDNHTPAQWRAAAAAFAAEGFPVSFAVTAAGLSPEQGACLKELAARGCEVMDHTPQHAMYRMRFPAAEAARFAVCARAPWVAEAHAETRTLHCRAELDFAHAGTFTFTGAITNGELFVADPALARRLTFSRKFFDRATGRGYGVSEVRKDGRRFVKDFYGRALKGNVSARAFTSLDQAAIAPCAELRRAQAELTRACFDRHGIPRPTMWIQPGGWEAFLDWARLRDTYGREFGYVGADAVVGGSPWNGCFNDPEAQTRGRWSFKPVFFYLDEGATLAQIKRQVADSVARRRSFIFISHMNGSRLAGKWAEWCASTRAFAAWLRASGIPVYTVSGLVRHVYDEAQDPSVSVFPSLARDLDGDGVADGWTAGAGGAAFAPARGTVALAAGQSVRVDGFCGLERGANALTFRLAGAPGARLAVELHQSRRRDGWFAHARRVFTVGPGGETRAELPVTVAPDCVGATAVFAAQGAVTLADPVFKPVK